MNSTSILLFNIYKKTLNTNKISTKLLGFIKLFNALIVIYKCWE